MSALGPVSFRLKVALFSSVVSALVLAASLWLVWRLAWRAQSQHLDRELRSIGQPNLDRPHGKNHFQRMAEGLALVSGGNSSAGFAIAAFDAEGALIFRSLNWPERLEPLELKSDFTDTAGEVEADGEKWRVARLGSAHNTLLLAAPMAIVAEKMTELCTAMFWVFPLGCVMVFAGAWLVAGRAMRPIRSLTQAVENVSAKGLDQRLPTLAHEPEFARLIAVFNEMMAQLEKAFHQAGRFSADAAHELKTPLTVLLIELEQGLQHAEPGSEQQKMFGRLIDELARLRAIVEKLLLLAQADAGRLPLQTERVDLCELVRETLEDVGVLAPELVLKSEIADELAVMGDRQLLTHVVQNLVTNAVKYNQSGGRIEVALRRADEATAMLRIGNTGPGIPAEARGRVFERFFRAEASRTRELGGAGLGLSLAREIAMAHGGDLTLSESREGWTEFTLQLPMAQGGGGHALPALPRQAARLPIN